MKEILKKLLVIQLALKAPKGQYNSFGKYAFRSCEDILEALKPILNEQQCVLTLSDKIEVVGNRYYVQATATLYDLESGENYSQSAYAREDDAKKGMDGSQLTGATSSYARKYALNGLFCIDDAKDADTNEFQQQNSIPQNNYAPPVKCPKCGKEVKGIKRPDGTSATPQEVLDSLGMCLSCYKKEHK